MRRSLIRLERKTGADVLRDAARAAAIRVEESPVGGGEAELRAVGGAEDARAADAARGRHAGDARLHREPLACEGRAEIADLVAAHHPDLAPREVGGLVQPDRRGVA